MKLILNIGVFFLNVVYFFHKLMPVKNRISVVSRQSDNRTLDVSLLLDELKKSHGEIDIRSVYMKIPAGLLGKIRYVLHMLGPEMHALATSKVVILEGYTITASVLRHKRGLKILQMWHALGILKKFGYCVKDHVEGYDARIIDALKMHKNYDMILASSEFCVPFYAKAFNYPKEKVKVMPLPRVDLLRGTEFMENEAKRIYDEYPALFGKKTVLYCPTFRKNGSCARYVENLIRAMDPRRYNLIVKLHPVDGKKMRIPAAACDAGNPHETGGAHGAGDPHETGAASDMGAPHESPGIFTCSDFTSMELLSVADFVVTDYSAFVFEAAVAEKPIFLYTPDIDEYVDRRGFCIDFGKELPADTHENAGELWKAVENREFSMERIKRFSDKFVDSGGHNTKNLANLVLLLYNSDVES